MKFYRKSDGSVDYHILLFFLNASFVVIGYWMEIAFGMLAQFKMVKIAVISISIIYLFAFRNNNKKYIASYKAWILNTFIGLLTIGLFFSSDFNWSLNRFLVFVPFLVYLNYFLGYLFSNYSTEEIKLRALSLFRIVYVFPILIFVTTGGGFQNVNIYGDTSLGFNSSHYAWSSVFILSSSLDIYFNSRSSKMNKVLLVLMLGFLLYLILISGSRSSYLCLALIMLAMVLSNRSIHFGIKLVMILIAFGSLFHFIKDDQSALVKRIERTRVQMEEGQDRVDLTNRALEILKRNDKVLLSGLGFDNFKRGLTAHTGIIIDALPHNTYLQILIDNGIIVFGFFLFFIFFRSIFFYLKYDIRNYLFFIPILVIPFFESNFGAGQFLFFPWIFFLLYYTHLSTKQFALSSLHHLPTDNETSYSRPEIRGDLP